MVCGVPALPQASCLLLDKAVIAPFPHLPTEDWWVVQKTFLGHSLVSLSDMVAVLGETTGCLALPNLRDKMKHHPEGYRILQCVPPHPSLAVWFMVGRETQGQAHSLGPLKGEPCAARLESSTGVSLALTLQVVYFTLFLTITRALWQV